MSDINTYINQSRQNGMSDEQIKQNLLSSGWTNEQVNGALGVSALNQQTDFDLVKKGQKMIRHGVTLTGLVLVVYIIWVVYSSDPTLLLWVGILFGPLVLLFMWILIILVSDWMILKGTHSSKLILLMPISAALCLFLGWWLGKSDSSSYVSWIGMILPLAILTIYRIMISKKIKEATLE